MMKIIDDIWFSNFGSTGTIGIVVTENETGERKAYIGSGSGIGIEADKKRISEWGGKITIEVIDRIFRLLGSHIFDFHPRAAKLMIKKKNFIVIAEDEPYFIQAYNMIKTNEQLKGTWTEEDEEIYFAMTGGNK